uniref:Uncharacterized protein n=1 Tax=Amphimedon queenslandica TaxID=400682 RepID=A0A1X7T545_AMPQE
MATMAQSFENVCSKVLCIDDLSVVYNKVKTIAARWKQFANSLYIRPATIDIIQADCGSTCELCLDKVLGHWLRKDYNYEFYGSPCWRRVCVAVKEGGGDPALAEDIAHEHPLSASTGGESSTDNSIYASPVRDIRLLDEIYELQLEFSDILKETRDAFKPELLPDILDYLETHVAALLGPNENNQAEEITEEFNNIQTTKDLFKVLQRKYISWFNYELIVKLVGVFLPNNQSLKGTWSDYKEKLKDYFLNRGGLLTDANALEFGIKDIPPGTQVMIAKVDRRNYKPADLFFFRRAIPKELNIPHVYLYFSFVFPGSLKLLHNIPDYLYSALFPLTTEIQQQLASIGIIELICGDYKCNLRKLSASQELQQSSLGIDICDPLWYENTSTPLHEAAWRGLKDEVQWLLNKFGYGTYHRGLHGWTPLHSASYDGHIEILQLLIHQYGIDPNEGDDNSVSSIHMASYKGHLSIVQYLVDTCHVPPDQPDNSNNTPLLYSAMGGHSDLLDFFIERKCDASHINSEGASLSLLACQSGKIALIHKLEKLNLFSLSSIDDYGFNVLHYSVKHNSVELYQYLLTLAINMKNPNGQTPLFRASWHVSSSVVEYIVSIQGIESLLTTNNHGWSCLHSACSSISFAKAGIVYHKVFEQNDAPIIHSNNTYIRCNIDFISRKKRIQMFYSLLKKASNCPNFNINAITNDGKSLLHLASRSGSTLLVKALEEYNINCTLTNDGMSPVHYAAWSGSTSVLSYIISQYNLNANDTDYTGRTPLVYSCWSGSINAVKYLINNHESDSNITDNGGMTCLHHSCRNGHIDITQYLIEVQHCDINKTDNEGRTLVHHAAWSGNFDLVQYLITEQGLSPTAVDKNGLTTLHYASQSLNLSLVKELITTYQLDPHQADSNGKLPIHYTVQFGDLLLLELYMKDYKCSLSLKDNNGWNIFHFSSLQGHTHFIKHIVNQYPQYASLVHSTNNDGSLALHLACQSGNIQLTTFLIDDMKCDVTATNTLYGSNCVLFACSSGNLDLVQLLIQQYKLEPININNTGFSVLHVAVQAGHTHILEWYSQEYSVDITNHTSNNKYTLAHYAALKGKLHCLQELINKYQCDVNATTTDGSTVLHKACEGGHVPVVLYLTSLPQCNVAAKTSNGSTVLHITCEYSDSLPILKHLIENHQLDLCAVNDEGMAPIHLACGKGRLNLVEYVINHLTLQSEIGLIGNIFKHHKTKSGRLALHLACKSGNIQLVTFLIDDMKCDVTATDTIGCNCVMYACFSGNLDLVQLLIQQYKLEPININNNGFSVLHAATQAGHTHILEWYSQEYSVDITNHTNNNKYTLAHSAALKGKLHCLQELINKYQCDVNAISTDGSTVLHAACAGGHVPVVLYLTSLSQCNVAAKTSNGSTALHITCQYSGSLPILKHLVDNHQLDLCAMNDNEAAPIHYACIKGRLNLAEYILEQIPSSLELLCRPSRDYTPFLTAVFFNQLEVIKYLISKKCNLSTTNNEGSGAVHISVERGHLNVLKYLINNNYCDPNATDHQDCTPLHVAVTADQLEALEYLLSKSIPPMSVVWLREIKCLLDSPHDIYNNPHNAVLINVQDKDGNTPLHVACQLKQQQMVSLLQKASLSHNDLLITNKKGQTPLHLAAASGHKDTAEALLSSVTGSSTHHDLLTATDNEGLTVFHTACSNGHIDMFRYLSSIYPQGVNVIDSRGRGLLHAACEGGDIGIVRTLIETHGLDPLTEDEDGITCLHLLAERKRVYIYQYLEPNIVSNPIPKDKFGCTPLHYASRSDNIRMVHYLIETFPCTPDDPDNNGYTSVHGACEAGSMELVQYFLADLNCNALAETNDFNTMLYFASKNSNLELVQILVERYNLKPRLHDIEVAQATNPDSSIVRYLEKVNHDMILDMVEEERRRVSKRTTTGSGIEEHQSTKRIKLGEDEA